MRYRSLLLACVIATLCAAAYAQDYGCPPDNNMCRLGRAMKALQESPEDPEHMYNIGLIYQSMGDHPRAINAFTMYVAVPGLKPAYAADGYNNRGISQRATLKPEQAITDYSKAIELDSKNPRFYTNRGNAQLDLKKSTEALADYAKAIAVDPNYAAVYSARGHYFASVAKTDEALTDLGKAIVLDPKHPETYYTRAMVYRSRKEFAKSISDLDKYIAIGPGSDQYLADGLLNRGIAYAETGNLEKAIADVTKAIEVSPRYADAYGARSAIYRRMNKIDLAEADKKRADQLLAERNH